MKEFRVGQELRIRYYTYRAESVTCTIKWCQDNRLGLIFPENQSQMARNFPVGKEIEAVVYTDSGVYVFDSIVINSPLELDFIIELPEESTRMQRRDYVRASFNHKLDLIKDGMTFATKTMNIGGGGLRFVGKKEIENTEVYDFLLHLPDGAKITGKGIVLYSFIRGRIIVSAIKFLEINETDRNKIIKKCFEEEVKNLNLNINRVKFSNE